MMLFTIKWQCFSKEATGFCHVFWQKLAEVNYTEGFVSQQKLMPLSKYFYLKCL